MKKIAYTNPIEGNTCIVVPVEKAKIEEILGPMTDAEYEAHVRERSIPANAINVMDIDDNQLPDREFRNAWKIENQTLTHDLEKARNLQLDKIRRAREPKLAELDKAFMLALEKSEPTNTIVAAKQRLRDITEPLKAANLTSIDDVKNAFPDELK